MLASCVTYDTLRGDVKIPTYKPHTNHKKPSVSSHTLAPTTICDLSHSVCGSPLIDLGHISSVTYDCHPLWFVYGHRKKMLTSPLRMYVFSPHTADSIYRYVLKQQCPPSTPNIYTAVICLKYHPRLSLDLARIITFMRSLIAPNVYDSNFMFSSLQKRWQ